MTATLEACIEEGIREVDDRQLSECLKWPDCAHAAEVEIRHRKQFEAEWSGDLPASQGPLSSETFMRGLSDTTLKGMMKGRAGEPDHVISMARYVLESRKAPPTFTSSDYPPSVRTDHEKSIFDRLSYQIKTGHPKDARAAADILYSKFGYRT